MRIPCSEGNYMCLSGFIHFLCPFKIPQFDIRLVFAVKNFCYVRHNAQFFSLPYESLINTTIATCEILDVPFSPYKLGASVYSSQYLSEHRHE
jgi:hypothetical protein